MLELVGWSEVDSGFGTLTPGPSPQSGERGEDLL
jgi:hypothetical protein